MKNLKVKSILFSLITLLAVSFLTSCEQEIIETQVVSEAERIQQLESDANYIALNQLNNELLIEVKHTMITKNISADDLKNMYHEARHDLLKNFFEGTEVTSIMNKIAPLAQQLATDYSDLIPASQGFTANSIDGLDNVESFTSVDSRCGWQYYVCLGAANSGYAACLAGTAGWGIFACYAAYVGTVALCYDSYC